MTLINPRVTVIESGGVLGGMSHYEIGAGRVAKITAVGGGLEVDRPASYGELIEVASAATQAVQLLQADIKSADGLGSGRTIQVTVIGLVDHWSVSYDTGDQVPPAISALVSTVMEIVDRHISGPRDDLGVQLP